MTEDPLIAFIVKGNPIPKQRPRVRIHNSGKAHAYTPKRTKRWEATVRDAARAAMKGRDPVAGPVAVELHIWRRDKRRADADNMEKAVTDACNKVVWDDDDQVVEMHRYKGLDREHPRVKVTVWELEDMEW